MSDDERVTSKNTAYDFDEAAPATSWYLIVSTTAAVSTRVAQLGDGVELVIGRGAKCDITIDHDAVSRRHATIRRHGDRVTVTDLGSSNGTTVNGTTIEGPRRLIAGDIIGVGPATAVLARSSSTQQSRQVATVGELEERLDAEVDRAVRYHRPLGLLMIRLDGPVEAVADHVEAFAAKLRRMDLLAEYGGDEFAVVLPETSADGAAQLARRAAESVAIAVHTGSATFPEDGSHAGELIGVARERLRGARAPRKRASTISAIRALGPHIIADDPLMKYVFELAKRVAGSAITVLIVGETGVGKEVVAEAVHRLSPRAASPYVRLNCASLSESLVEAELFGHEKGAFTGAVAEKRGFFEVASGGTLFLDEIGELPLSTQAKLLRVLEQRCIVRVGGTTEIPIDVRLVCATNRKLELEVQRGRFREDLYFRVSAFVIPVPPLRDRRSEIPLLAVQFARELSSELDDHAVTIAPDAMAALSAYDWPGNVRELRNVIERAVVMSVRGRIELGDLPDKLRIRSASRGRGAGALDVRQRDLEREAVIAALEAHRGNQTQAARSLGISRFRLMRLLEKHDLPRPGKA